jgi:hypothetical protein
METKKVSVGNLRSISYDASKRLLVVERSSGTFKFANVSSEVWRRFSTSSSMLSFFHDTIEEDYVAKRIK